MSSSYRSPAVHRAVRILQALASAEQPLGVSELGKSLDLPKASVFRIVSTLEAEGFLERLAGDRFDVGHSAFEVGAAYRRRTDLETIFRKISRELVANYNETVQLAVLLGTDVLYVSKEESSEPVRLVSDIGSRLPAHVTSLGKALLACLADEDVKLLYGSTRLKKRTPNSHGSVQTLLKDLQVIRTRGWAWDNEETSVGLQCVGGPVFDGTNESIAAISISIPVQRVTPDRIQELGRAVMHAASRMSNFLGSQESESVIGFQKN